MSDNLPYSAFFAGAVILLSGCAASTPGSTPSAVRGASEEPAKPAARPGNTVLYTAATSGRYRLDSRDSLAMQMPDGSFQRTVLVKISYLTFTIAQGSGRLAASIVLDSIMLDRPNSMFQPLIDSAQGTEWKGSLTASGRFDSLASNHPSLFGEQVRTMLNRLIPVLPAGGIEAGKAWTDSMTVPFHLMAGFSALEERSAEYRAGKAEDAHGTRTLPIRSTIVYRVSGSGAAMGPEIHMEGNGKAEGTHRLSYTGHLMEAQVTDSISLTLTVPEAGQTVPATLIATYSLTPIP